MKNLKTLLILITSFIIFSCGEEEVKADLTEEQLLVEKIEQLLTDAQLNLEKGTKKDVVLTELFHSWSLISENPNQIIEASDKILNYYKNLNARTTSDCEYTVLESGNGYWSDMLVCPDGSGVISLCADNGGTWGCANYYF